LTASVVFHCGARGKAQGGVNARVESLLPRFKMRIDFNV